MTDAVFSGVGFYAKAIFFVVHFAQLWRIRLELVAVPFFQNNKAIPVLVNLLAPPLGDCNAQLFGLVVAHKDVVNRRP